MPQGRGAQIALFLSALLALGATAERDRVRFKVITPGGFVGFSAGAKWPVIAMQTHLPVAVAAFQVPNPADEDTPDSTNLAISVIDLRTPEGQRAASHTGKQCSELKAKTTTSGQWTTFAQDGCPGTAGARYSIRDAQATIAGLAVVVRLAWPHLLGNAKDYDHEMELLFRDTLSSVTGGLGAYSPKPGEVVRRPE